MFPRFRLVSRGLHVLVATSILLTSVPTVLADTAPEPAMWKIPYNPPVVSTFSGAATYNYPIEVPPGRGGMQPNVSLSYSSRSADGLVAYDGVDAGPLGVGWSVDQMSIQRTNWGNNDCGAQPCFDDEFVLTMNGAGHELVPAGTKYWGRFYAKDAPGVYVERRNYCGLYDPLDPDKDIQDEVDRYPACGDNDTGGSTANMLGEYWIVRTPDGTQARLGYRSNSEQTVDDVDARNYYDHNVWYGYGGRVGLHAVKRWRVDRMTDVFGNQMAFTYEEFQGHGCDKWSLPKEIKYNQVDGVYLSRVVFSNNGNDAEGGVGPLFTKIEVFDNDQLVRRYQLAMKTRTWNTCTPMKVAYLTRIDVYDGSGSSKLPPTRIEYVWLDNWKDGCCEFPRVRQVANGYGAGTEFTYDGGDGYLKSDDWTYPIRDPEAVGQTYRVTAIRSYDGVNEESSLVTYAYEDKCRAKGSQPCAGPNAPKYATITGHERTTVKTYEYDGSLVATAVHSYHVDYDRLGREDMVQIQDGGGALLQQRETTWSADPLGAGAEWAHLDETVSTDLTGDEPLSTKATYGYEEAYQGGVQYGLQTHVREYGDAGDSVPYRTSVTSYNVNPDPDVWIVNRPQEARVYEGDEGGEELSYAESFYDGNTTHEPPIKGALTLAHVHRLDGGPALDTEYEYDGWGNVIETVDPLGRRSTVEYDDVYHMYPTRACAAVGSDVEQCTYTEYYGVNAAEEPARFDLPEVADWERYASNPVMSYGDYSWDSKRVAGPKVLREGSGYRMWYHTWDDAGDWRIGHATSSDGVTWEKGGSVLLGPQAGTFRDGGVREPAVVEVDGGYEMWFAGVDAQGIFSIGRAESTDGLVWINVQQVLTAGDVAWLGGGDIVDRPDVIKIGDTYHMWFQGGASGTLRIGHATSPDGVSWTVDGAPVLESGPGGSWDEITVRSPDVVWDGETFHMWYTGKGNLGETNRLHIGYATSSDGEVWEKHAGNPVLQGAGGGAWEHNVLQPEVVEVDGWLMMWYAGMYAGKSKIGLAETPKLLDGLLGQVYCTWDDNGEETATKYGYDQFGRLTKVVRPGDSAKLPTTEYWYDETTSPDRVVHEYYREGNRDTLYNTAGNWHFHKQGYIYQGTHFRISPTQVADTRPLYRLFNDPGKARQEDTLYTASDGERQGLIDQDWEDQGILGYVWESPGPGREKLYRCYAGSSQMMNHSLAVGDDPCPDGDKEGWLGVYVTRARAAARIGAFQREVSGEPGVIESYIYFDGLGREIQTRAEAADGQWAVGSTAYDARGQVARSYLPQFEDGSTYTSPPREQTVYEAEGPNLYHVIGSASGDVWLSPSAGQAANYLTYGPYQAPSRVGPEQIVRFRLAIDTISGNNDVIATLDVFDYTAWQTVAQRDIRRNGFEGGLSNFSDFSLIFDTTGRGGHQLEYRVYWRGKAQMAHDRTTVLWNAPGGKYTTTQYDALGRAVWVDNADGTHTETIYAGRVTTAIDANGHVRRYTNDAFGRMVQVEEFTGTHPSATVYATTLYAYDARDNLVQVTDALGNVTTMTYDALGRKIGMSDPDMGDWTYTYDPVGNLIGQTDAKDQTLTFVYDDLNRLLSKSAGGQVLAAYEYDCGGSCASGNYGVGRRTGMTDPSGSTTWSYDARGRVEQEVKTIDPAGDFTTAFAYDAADRVTGTTYPDGEEVTNAYDAGGALEVLAGAATYVQDVTYSASGQIETLLLGNGLTTAYTYDELNLRLTRIQVGSLLDLAYTYDSVGNVLSITDGENADQAQYFAYDHLNRLTHGWTDGVGEGQYDRAYTYDEIGNMLSKAGAAYTYPASGPGSVRPHAVTSVAHASGTNTYTYDDNGNMRLRRVVSDTQTTRYWQRFDIENRLDRVTILPEGHVITFTYDGDGNRVAKVADGVTTVYVGGLYEKQVGSGAETKYYHAAGQRVAMRKDGELFYLHGDHLGSTSLTTCGSAGGCDGVSNGEMTARVLYTPYGEVRYAEGTLPTDYGFTGQRSEADIGLMDYKARFYDPFLGRFVSADTIVPNPESPQAFNRYSYVMNNPLKYTDPTGHFTEDESREYFGVSNWDEFRELYGDDLYTLMNSDLTWGDVIVASNGDSSKDVMIMFGFKSTDDGLEPTIAGVFQWGGEGRLDYSGDDMTLSELRDTLAQHDSVGVYRTDYRRSEGDFTRVNGLGWGTPPAFNAPGGRSAFYDHSSVGFYYNLNGDTLGWKGALVVGGALAAYFGDPYTRLIGFAVAAVEAGDIYTDLFVDGNGYDGVYPQFGSSRLGVGFKPPRGPFASSS